MDFPDNDIDIELSLENEELEIKNVKGINYTRLHHLLQQERWQEADQETIKVMLQVANSENIYFRKEDIERFPSSDLRTINQLWLEYSKNKFGFSIQEDIYARLGSAGESENEVWEQFGCIVGWKQGKHWLNYEKLTFDLNLAPYGHLPTIWMDLSAHNRTSCFSLLSLNL
ncbi:MAG: GUN4 domain-containing protein [Cyanobacteria bacterium P01_G01_bin.39]